MKLVAFQTTERSGIRSHLGVVSAEGVIEVSEAAHAYLTYQRRLSESAASRIVEVLAPTQLQRFIESGQIGRELVESAVDFVLHNGVEVSRRGGSMNYAWDELDFLPVISEGPMLRDFMAFEQHLKNIYPKLGRDIPDEWDRRPVYYKGNPASTGAHKQRIVIPSYAEGELDMEFEFAAILGTGGRDIHREEALDHVFGYTIYNDFSARGIQAKEMSVGLGPAKGKDFIGGHVLGPVVVTADEITDPYSLAMKAWVNGEVWADGNSGDMRWRFEDMIAYASMSETLRPGEVFGSGTVGNGSAQEQGKMLSSGDSIRLEVEQIGVLENVIVEDDADERKHEIGA